MLKNVLSHVRGDRVYLALFLLLFGLYLFLIFFLGNDPATNSSPAMQALKAAEQSVEENIQESGSLEKYLQDRPGLIISFYGFSGLMIIMFALGCVIDLMLMVNKPWRKSVFMTKPSPPNQSWNLSMLLRLAVHWMLASLILNFAMGFYSRFTSGGLSENFAALFHTAILDILCFIFIVQLIKKHNGSWKDLGFSVPGKRIIQEMAVGLGGYMAVIPIFFLTLVALMFLASLSGYEPDPHPLVQVFVEEEKRAPSLVVFSIVLATIIGPVIEEIFFRGFCYPIFKNRWGRKWAMILSSLFFACIHLNEFAFIPIFILGFGLAFLYEKRGNLIAPIALHVFHNFIFITYFFLAKEILFVQQGG